MLYADDVDLQFVKPTGRRFVPLGHVLGKAGDAGFVFRLHGLHVLLQNGMILLECRQFLAQFAIVIHRRPLVSQGSPCRQIGQAACSW